MPGQFGQIGQQIGKLLYNGSYRGLTEITVQSDPSVHYALFFIAVTMGFGGTSPIPFQPRTPPRLSGM